MSTNYYLYTEIKINDKWCCINNKLKEIDKEKIRTINYILFWII